MFSEPAFLTHSALFLRLFIFYSILWYSIALCCTVLYCTVLYYSIRYKIFPHVFVLLYCRPQILGFEQVVDVQALHEDG